MAKEPDLAKPESNRHAGLRRNDEGDSYFLPKITQNSGLKH